MVDQLDQLTQKLRQKALSRRNFLASAGVVTAATMVGCGNDTTFTPTQPVTPTPPAAAVTDVDVLNFALNLEYAEANFYLLAATGTGLTATDSLSGATVTAKSNAKVTFKSSFYASIAAELAQTELQHVRAIQATIKVLGGTPVSAPALDFTNGFNGAAAAAGVPGGAFDPFADDLSFIIGALTFEDVGVTAYTGAATLISNATVLSAAAGIQAAEAYHAGALRTLLVADSLSNGTTTSAAINNYNLIVALRASLGGGNETTLTTGGLNGTSAVPSTIVEADTTNSLAFARTTDQVLHIVYAKPAGAGVAGGGFFPSGLNGTIKTTTA